MKKQLIKDAGKLFGIYAVCALICVFAVPALAAFLEEYAAYQWAVTVVFTGLILLLQWNDVRSIGQKHAHWESLSIRRGDTPPEKHVHLWYGYAVTAIAQIPALAVIFAAIVCKFASPIGYGVADAAIRMWYMSFITVYTTFESAAPWLYLLFPALYCAVTGSAYLGGIAQDKKLSVLIKRSTEKLKNKKETPKKKK